MFRQNQDMIRSNYICKSYDKSDKCEFEKQEINKEAKTDFSSESQIIKTEKSRSIVENESQVNSETDKISQETIKENFPFPTFLKDQLEILTEIVDAIEEGYKYIILESGVGKSAIAATLANIYESSFILSDNKKLQEKYHEEYDLINNDKFHVSNHSDAFNEFEKLDKRKLLIVDDAHKFDENIADFFSYKIRLSAFDDELIDSFYCDVRNKEKKEIDVGLDFINHLSLDDEMVNLIKYNIGENPDDWIWFYDKYYGGMIIFKPLNLENILKKYLLNKAETYIFMSSTILNKEIFADELGLDISEVKFIHKDFPFSSDANQIYLRNCAGMNNSQNVKLVSPFIEDILEKHKNEKGIIHTDKPEYTSCIENQINNPRFMFHIDDDDLKEFKNSSNSVLVSEDRVEGMDFPKDSCRFQIILRQHLIPYDEIAIYKDNESNWYSYKKAIYLVQLLQRAARSEDDGCITYILDERILTTIRKDIMDYHFIPDYILDSIEDMDVGGCELISDNVKKQLGVYYLFDYYSKNHKEDELSNKVLHYKSYGADKTDYTGQIDCSGGVINFGSDGQMLRKLCPDDDFDKEDIREILTFALESRRRVKEQLKKIGGMEFYDVNFSYIDLEENRDCPVGVKEQASSTLIPEGDLKPGHLYSVGPSENGKLGVYKFETEMMKGNGKFTPNGIGSKKDVNEAVKIAYQYFKSNAGSISGQISYKDKDYVMQVKDLHGVGMTRYLTLATFIALCSVATNRKVLPSLAILGNFSLGGTVDKIQNLADTLQVCLDNGAKKLLIPMSSYVDIGLVPSDLLVKFTLIPYNTPEEAVMKAFGIE